MSIECDEELDTRMLESGACRKLQRIRADIGDTKFLPDEALACLAEHSCESLTDKLAFSLISDQHREVVRDSLRLVSESHGVRKRSIFESSNFVEYFANWSLIRLFSPPTFSTDEELSKTSLSFYCKGCRTLIITQNEVESPHYHGGHGPAFLAHCVFNCHHSEDEAYETQFTTGVYRVCDVTCLKCHSRVGKRYIEARDPSNFFKVGKILLEQTLLTMPKCCNNRKLNAFPPEHYYCARETGVSCFCSVCLDAVRSSIAASVLEMTRNLDPLLTMKLYSVLNAERQILLADQLGGCTSDCSPVSTPSAISPSSISRRFGDAITRFVRKSLSSQGSSSGSSQCDLLEISQSHHTEFLLGSRWSTFDDASLSLKNRLSDDQAMLLSHCIGERLAMIPECQNWISCTKFIGDLISCAARHSMLVFPTGSAGIHLYRSVILESMMSFCGSISFHSVTLLLSRLPNVEDRRAVVQGTTKNPNSCLAKEEMESLRQLGGGSGSQTSPSSSRWSSSFSAGSASFTSSSLR